MSNRTIRYLSADDVKNALTMDEAIKAMREAFEQLSKNQVNVPMRMHLDIKEFNGVELIKPVYSPSIERIGIKVISLFRENPSKGLPFSHALMMLFNARTGEPLAIMEANYLTAIRTGAASGLATDVLARTDASTVAIFGAGLQGRTQLEAVSIVRKIEKAFIFDPTPKKAEHFAEEMSEKLSFPVDVANRPEILIEADIICTATTASVPVFSYENVKPGAHINAVGAFKPQEREIPSEIVSSAKVVVDQRETCLKESGDLLIPIKEGVFSEDQIYGEIGEIVSGDKTGRKSDDEITFFKSVGSAVQDIASANRVLLTAEKQNLGVRLLL